MYKYSVVFPRLKNAVGELTIVRDRLSFQLLLQDTDILQGSVAIHFRRVGTSSDTIITSFLMILTVKKSLKTGQYLMKL